MAKPKTKGDPIQVRLDLADDSLVRKRANDAGQTPAEYIGQCVVKALRGVMGKIEGRARNDAILIIDDPCKHPKAKVLVSSTGLHRCSCGAVRGVDGEWR